MAHTQTMLIGNLFDFNGFSNFQGKKSKNCPIFGPEKKWPGRFTPPGLVYEGPSW